VRTCQRSIRESNNGRRLVAAWSVERRLSISTSFRPALLPVEQGYVLLVRQACITEQTFQQTRLDKPTSMVWKAQVKINAFFGKDVVTSSHAGYFPAGSLEGFEVTFSLGTRKTGHLGYLNRQSEWLGQLFRAWGVGTAEGMLNVNGQPPTDCVHNVVQGFVNRFTLRPTTFECRAMHDVSTVVIRLNNDGKSPVVRPYAVASFHN